jgi:mRNA interferase HigB
MRVLSYKALREHWEKPGRRDSEHPLIQWFEIVEKADWSTPAQIKDQFRNASFLGDRVIFNIAGNKYRIVTVVKYKWRMVYIRFVGSHAEYDALNAADRTRSV